MFTYVTMPVSSGHSAFGNNPTRPKQSGLVSHKTKSESRSFSVEQVRNGGGERNTPPIRVDAGEGSVIMSLIALGLNHRRN